MGRRLISSGSTFETDFAYSRAVVDGDDIFVAGTTGFNYRSMTIADDIVAQAEQAFLNVEAALAEAGAEFGDVVRVRYLLSDGSDFAKLGPVLRRFLGDARPAATMMVVGLLDPRMRIEIEVTARKRQR